MKQVDTNDSVLYLYDDDLSAPKSALGGTNIEKYYEAEWGDNGNLVQFKLHEEGWGDLAYFRLQCAGITEASIITINEPIE